VERVLRRRIGVGFGVDEWGIVGRMAGGLVVGAGCGVELSCSAGGHSCFN
jgi:hypothetical protein